MNKKISILACSAAFIGLGIAMPQCPADKALQQQVDALQQGGMDMTRKLSAVDGQVKKMGADFDQTKQLMAQLAGIVNSQKEELAQMDAALKDLQAKAAASSKKGGKAKRH